MRILPPPPPPPFEVVVDVSGVEVSLDLVLLEEVDVEEGLTVVVTTEVTVPV